MAHAERRPEHDVGARVWGRAIALATRGSPVGSCAREGRVIARSVVFAFESGFG
jgi:hypothetical protein